MKKLTILFFSFISFVGLASEVVDVTQADVLNADNKDWLIIDVRSAEEYAEGHVPGAINIAHSEMAGNLDKILAHKNKPVVVYCRSGYRAGKAAKVLLKNDFTQVKHLDGDMLGWQEAGQPIEK